MTDLIKDQQESESKVELLTALVRDVFDIEQLKLGSSVDKYFIEFRGMLTRPSEEAFDYLQEKLKPYYLTPLLRHSEGKHLVILKKGLITAHPTQNRVNIILFIITFFSVLLAGLFSSYSGPLTTDLAIIWSHLKGSLVESIAFAFSLLGILTAHEFGHYFAAQYHNAKVTLPFFIPFPLSPIGTMGAFIRMLEPPKNKKVLLDIGIAGPLAGLIVTIPVLILGLSLSSVEQLPRTLPEGFFFEGNSIFYLMMKFVIHGAWLPEPTSFSGLPPFIHWVRYFFTGLPLPAGGMDVIIHPIAWAGWVGLLITSLNLLPAGQLDGGHLIYSLFGDNLKWLRPLVLVILILLGFMWSGWWLWAFLVLLFGNQRAQPLDEITELDSRRRAVAIFGLIIMILIFMPVPILGV